MLRNRNTGWIQSTKQYIAAKWSHVHWDRRRHHAHRHKNQDRHPIHTGKSLHNLLPSKDVVIGTSFVGICIFIACSIMTLKARNIRQQLKASTIFNELNDPFIPQRTSHDVCVVRDGDHKQCFPMKCDDPVQSSYFYHRTIIRGKGINRSIAQHPTQCLVSTEYKFVYLDALHHQRSDSIFDALRDCLCPDDDCSPQFFRRQEQCDHRMLEDEEYFVFSFVRDPYARLVSDWFSTKENKGTLWKNMVNKGEIGKNQIPIPLKQFVSNPQSIDSFVSVDDNMWTKQQSSFILSDQMCPTVNFVGKLENAQKEDWKLILKHISNRYDSFPQKECMNSLHFETLHPEEESWIKVLMNDSETQHIIHKMFEDDFEYFGYSRYV